MKADVQGLSRGRDETSTVTCASYSPKSKILIGRPFRPRNLGVGILTVLPMLLSACGLSNAPDEEQSVDVSSKSDAWMQNLAEYFSEAESVYTDHELTPQTWAQMMDQYDRWSDEQYTALRAELWERHIRETYAQYSELEVQITIVREEGPMPGLQNARIETDEFIIWDGERVEIPPIFPLEIAWDCDKCFLVQVTFWKRTPKWVILAMAYEPAGDVSRLFESLLSKQGWNVLNQEEYSGSAAAREFRDMLTGPTTFPMNESSGFLRMQCQKDDVRVDFNIYILPVQFWGHP